MTGTCAQFSGHGKCRHPAFQCPVHIPSEQGQSGFVLRGLSWGSADGQNSHSHRGPVSLGSPGLHMACDLQTPSALPASSVCRAGYSPVQHKVLGIRVQDSVPGQLHVIMPWLSALILLYLVSNLAECLSRNGLASMGFLYMGGAAFLWVLHCAQTYFAESR